MKTPSFWSKKNSLRSQALRPLGAVYGYVTQRRLARGAPKKLDLPVICVGNLNAGGTGKTPTVIALAQRLMDRNVKVHIVTRGYGGKIDGPVRVDPSKHTAQDVGDEPLLMAAFAPVWKSVERVQGAEKACKNGAEVILLDDGFQNPELHKDLNIVVVDSFVGFGNGRCIPAGPLREPIEVGLARADFLLKIGEGQAEIPSHGTQLLEGRLRVLETGMPWEGLPVFAFAGIGYPEKFFRTLKGLGVDLRGYEALGDHQELSPALLRRLGDQAAKLSAQPVTTEKDAVRLPSELRGRVLTVPVRLALSDWSALDAAIDRILQQK